jgi:hypothetical protein
VPWIAAGRAQLRCSFAAGRASQNASTCKTVQITTFAVCSMPLQVTRQRWYTR